MNDEEQIRRLVEQWAEAVHTGDMDAVLTDHADDIVMFDVPPPHDGVRGIEAYRETWPGFFQWQASGAKFEIVELDVTAGDDVAYAFALLHCATPEEIADKPDVRLRLTLGLRREGDRWVVAHEHHSFCDLTSPTDEQDVRAVHEAFSEETRAGDLDALMSQAAPHGVYLDTPDLAVRVGGDLAVSWGIDRIRVDQGDGSVEETHNRSTRVFARRGGRWLMVHQHLSVPVEE